MLADVVNPEVNGPLDPFPRFIQAHTSSHAFGQMRQFTSNGA